MHSAISKLRIALYVRVSSERQGKISFLTRQVAEQRQRIAQERGSLDDEACFIDRGISGPSLARPAFKRHRERAACGDLDRLYILTPDRLVRSSASLALLADDFTEAGVELIFLDPKASVLS